MKKIVLFIACAAFLSTAYAQVKTPQPSPMAKVEQVVGLTNVTLEYSRPAMRGRTVFGDLVPFDKLWRTGANANTKIMFDQDVMVGGKELKKGTYALFTKPGKDQWEVIFYSDASNWGTPQNWDESKVAAKVMTKAMKAPKTAESFTIMFADVMPDGANMHIHWADTMVSVPVKVMTDQMVMASIDQALSGPSGADYYAAAVYYKDSGKDMKKAKEYMDKAMSMIEKPGFWQLRQQSLILAANGEKKEAIKVAKMSLEGAKAAGNADYVKMNEDSLKEWGAM
ncbi:DUF2911 domain-containing protein [Gangjinia marincola]|uniref:DUF2911 domain-containing protein n=1 Tax=Gangjinia marincola TaxID=578463 RepID=A0ABP3XTJ6_9FLAO